MPMPSLAEARMHLVAREADDVARSPAATRSGSALGRSILLMTGMIVEVGLERQVDVGQRLRLDALRGVDDEERALAGGQRCARPRR